MTDYYKERLIRQLRKDADQLDSIEINESTVDLILDILEDVEFYVSFAKRKMIKEPITEVSHH